MEITQYIFGIVAAIALSAGWIAVQILAKKIGTKNHFDHPSASCSDFDKNCGCDGSGCHEEKYLRKV